MELYKSALENLTEISESVQEDNTNVIEVDENSNSNVNSNYQSNDNVVKVPNTLKNIPFVITFLGFSLICIGMGICLFVNKKNK